LKRAPPSVIVVTEIATWFPDKVLDRSVIAGLSPPESHLI